jgi:hypothetical protein
VRSRGDAGYELTSSGVVIEHDLERRFKDVHTGVQIVLADREGRGDAEDSTHSGQLDDIHVQASFETGRGDRLPPSALAIAWQDDIDARPVRQFVETARMLPAHDLVPTATRLGSETIANVAR